MFFILNAVVEKLTLGFLSNCEIKFRTIERLLLVYLYRGTIERFSKSVKLLIKSNLLINIELSTFKKGLDGMARWESITHMICHIEEQKFYQKSMKITKKYQIHEKLPNEATNTYEMIRKSL